MKVVGFTFIRNAVTYDYPIVEAIQSILPVCDEVIVSIGNSADNTEELIKAIGSGKIKIYHSTWDDSLREGGKVLAKETDKAFAHVPGDADWCFYIQGDEVVHEKYHSVIRAEMEKYKDDQRVEGLLFKYKHFYGSYDYVGDTRKWYNREIRIIRNDKTIQSYRDAQGFRKKGRKLNVKPIDAFIYHYGWVKHPYHQLQKQSTFYKLWLETDTPPAPIPKTDEALFDYSHIDSLVKFTGTHPQAMHERISKKNWTFDFDISKKNLKFTDRILYWIEKKTGKRLFDYKNYKII